MTYHMSVVVDEEIPFHYSHPFLSANSAWILLLFFQADTLNKAFVINVQCQ